MLLCPLLDKYNEYCFEADAQATVDQVVNFRLWLHTGQRKMLLPPSGYPPYLDCQFLLYTSATYVVDALKQVRLVDPKTVPTEASLAIYTTRRVNVVCRIVAALAVFAIAIRFVHSAVFAFAASLVFLLLTQLVQIDLLRPDHAAVAALSWLLYLSLALLRPRRDRTASLTGISLLSAALATTKVTCIAFLLIPATAVFFLLLQRRVKIRALFIPSLVFAVAALAFSIRYLIHHQQAPTAIRRMFGDLKAWQLFAGGEPHFYYHWNLLLPDGVWLLGIVAVSWLVLALKVARTRNAGAALLLLCTLAFSAAAYGVLKYQRGGYHLALLYVTSIIMAVGVLRLSFRPHRYAGLLGIGCSFLLLPTLYSQSIFYREQRRLTETLAHTTDAIRIQPRIWIRDRVAPGARITIPVHSEWAMPPMFDLGLDIKYRFLDMPYLDSVALKNYEPPAIESIAAETDLVILNDYHRKAYLQVMRRDGFDALASRWEAFFDKLAEAFEVVDFSAPSENYGVRAIRIIIVNPASLRSAGK